MLRKKHTDQRRASEVSQSRRVIKWAGKMHDWAQAPPEERSSRPPSRPPFVGYRDEREFNPERFMCVIPFPWLDRTRDNVVEWGVACNGCKISESEPYTSAPYKKQRILYTQEDFIGHFITCERAQALYKRSYQHKIAGRERLFSNAIRGHCHLTTNEFFVSEPETEERWRIMFCPERRAESNKQFRREVREELRRPRRARATAGDAA